MLIGNLRNVDKSVNSRNNTGKRAVCSHADNSNLYGIAHMVVIFKNNPRVVLSLFVAERNFSLFGVERLNVNLYGIAHKHYLGRIFNSLPRKLGNVHHSVNAAYINKCAVAGERLNYACETVAHGDIFPNLILCRLALLLEHTADRAYRSAASADFNNAEGNLLTL